VDEYAAWRKWMNMWINMDGYAGKGESRNHWSSEDEHQARTGKDESSKHEQQARSWKGDKFRAPGAAREQEEQQEKL